MFFSISNYYSCVLSEQKERWTAKHSIFETELILECNGKHTFWGSWIKLLFIIGMYKHRFESELLFRWGWQQIRNWFWQKLMYLKKSRTRHFKIMSHTLKDSAPRMSVNTGLFSQRWLSWLQGHPHNCPNSSGGSGNHCWFLRELNTIWWLPIMETAQCRHQGRRCHFLLRNFL